MLLLLREKLRQEKKQFLSTDGFAAHPINAMGMSKAIWKKSIIRVGI